jgi:hypothetical protein
MEKVSCQIWFHEFRETLKLGTRKLEIKSNQEMSSAELRQIKL